MLTIMIINNRFQILKGYENNYVTIGFGSYGQVKLAKDIQTTKVVAVKVINKIAKNEVFMHNGLYHPKIIRLIDVHIDMERAITYMVLEYADDGTLLEKIKTETISKKNIRRYFKDVCQAIAYLHAEKIMHRDIKPQNILLTKNNEAKLCDFGFAAQLGQRKTLCGTYEYMSPEMIQNRPYDFKIDIWALGILYFEMIAGHAPFRGDKPQDVLEQMKTKIYFCQRFEQEDIGLIKLILRVTPHKRPTIEEILDYPILKNMEAQEKDVSNMSTTSTQETKAKSSTQYISQSCNPKKMAELQKVLQRENQKQQNPKPQNQKQTYPPIYVPKAHHKFGFGISVPVEQAELKSHSPAHINKVNQSISTYHPPYKVNKANSTSVNSSFKSMVSPKYPNSSQPPLDPRINPFVFQMNTKNQTNYGRFS